MFGLRRWLAGETIKASAVVPHLCLLYCRSHTPARARTRARVERRNNKPFQQYTIKLYSLYNTHRVNTVHTTATTVAAATTVIFIVQE